MITIMEIATKIIDVMKRKAWDKAEHKHKVLKILKALGIAELKDNVESVYTHALVEYAVEANPAELTLLFAEKSVRKAFQEELYKKKEAFDRSLDKLLKSRKVSTVVTHIYKSAADLKPEIQRFQELYQLFTLQSASAAQLKMYNESNRFMMEVLEDMERKSFDFQAEQYLLRLKKDFQKDFPDEKPYIYLNGEIRIEVETETGTGILFAAHPRRPRPRDARRGQVFYLPHTQHTS